MFKTLYECVLDRFRKNLKSLAKQPLATSSTNNQEADSINKYFGQYDNNLRLDEMEKSLVDQVKDPYKLNHFLLK